MEICETKDKRGRKKLEYKIHFQGWSSSWDRKVPEEFVLRDTEENRKLQRDLADQSHLQQGAYLYRKERKKRRKLSDKIRFLQENADVENNSEGFKQSDPEIEYSSSIESNESNDENDRVFLSLGDFMHKNLELDAKIINQEKVLVKLPAEINVVSTSLKCLSLKCTKNNFKIYF